MTTDEKLRMKAIKSELDQLKRKEALAREERAIRQERIASLRQEKLELKSKLAAQQASDPT